MRAKVMAVAATGLSAAMMLIPVQSFAAPPDHAGGEPELIRECMEIDQPGSYTLGGNLPGANGLLPSGDCIYVTADYVTIDLNGFVIDGFDATGAHASGGGIVNATSDPPYYDYTVVKNGTITGFRYGIDMIDARRCRIENMLVFKNASYGIGGGSRCLIAENIVNQNGSVDPHPIFAGLFAYDYSIVRGNVISENAGIGLRTAHGIVSGNVAANNDVGLHVWCPATVIGNTLIDNPDGNLVEIGDPNCIKADNTVQTFSAP